MPLSEADYQALRRDDLDSLESYLLDVDGLDAIFFLYVVCLYVAARLLCSWLAPGLHEMGATAIARKFTRQQYIVLFAQKAVVLPLCALGWWRQLLPPELLYLLTGTYVMSDSIVNRVPVRGGSWGGNLGVHAHHVGTVVLCMVGAHLPPWPVKQGALCILIGESGSLWLTVTMLHPTPTNIKIRFYAFVVSRFASMLIAVNVARELESAASRYLMLAVIAVLSYDSMRTLRSMSGVGGLAAGSLGRSDSLAVDLSKQGGKQD